MREEKQKERGERGEPETLTDKPRNRRRAPRQSLYGGVPGMAFAAPVGWIQPATGKS